MHLLLIGQRILGVLALALFLWKCGHNAARNDDAPMVEEPAVQALSVTKDKFGETADGPVDLYTLTNAQGMEVAITNYGGIIVSLLTPDRMGSLTDVVLGFDSLAPYLEGHPFFGAIVGRYGNRIGNARFELDGETYTLAANNNDNHIHGGRRGFDKYIWDAREVELDGRVGVRMTRTSPHLEEGYPGNLQVSVTYTIDNENTLLVEYEATTDRSTLCNLTNHSYFNLAGGGDVLSHEIMINAERFTAVDEELIPTGDLPAVQGTPFDFREAKPIGQEIDADHPQIKVGGGYDHNFVLRHTPGDGAMQLAAEVYDPSSGRVLQVRTTEPGVQFYTGNFLNGRLTGKDGRPYERRHGFCLETQHFPDSPNKPQFPSAVLRPGETYRTATSFSFSTR